MSEYKSFEDGWRKHSRIHKRIEKLQTTITKMKQKISQLEEKIRNQKKDEILRIKEKIRNKEIGYNGLIDRNIELQNRLYYEERVNTELKREIKRLKRTLKNQSELKGKINTLNSKTTHKHSVNKSWSGLSFPLTLPNIFSRI